MYNFINLTNMETRLKLLNEPVPEAVFPPPWQISGQGRANNR